jgi:hypothetical protein
MFAAVLAADRHAGPRASAPENRRNLAALPLESLEQAAVPRAEEFGHETRM